MMVAMLLVLGFVQMFLSFSLFYIFYEPDYICFDDDMSNPRPCDKSVACRENQIYAFDDSNFDQKSRA